MPEVNSLSTIARTARQPIAEGALFRPNFSPHKKVTCGVHHRLKSSANERKGQPNKGSHTDLDRFQLHKKHNSLHRPSAEGTSR